MRLRLTTLLALVLVAGCSREPATSRSGSSSTAGGAPHLEYGKDLTDAERKFGPSPRPHPNVTYQPDVVIPKDGAGAIEAAPTNGMTWTLKPDAAGVSDLAPGKILFATGRAVGRVLALQRKPSGVDVTLGPIELTDVIKEAKISVDEPIDLDRSLVYVAPDMPDPATERQAALPHMGFVPATWTGESTPYLPVATSPPVTRHRFTASPYAGPTGIGVNITSDAGGVKLISEAVLYLNQPRLHFDLDISGGKIRRAEVVLDGAAGILVRFQVASAGGVNGNIHESIPVPVDFSVPISGLGVPFAVTVRQHFVINTVFTAAGGLDATGHYAFTGSFHMGFRDGKFSTGAPTGFSAKRNLVDSLTGVSMGANGLAISYQAKVIVGIGAFGFVTGPFFGMNATYTAARGSGLGIVICNQESVDLSLVGGVGYAMPRAVTSAINFVLRALNAGEIKGEGGFQAPDLPVIKKAWVRPPVKACMPD